MAKELWTEESSIGIKIDDNTTLLKFKPLNNTHSIPNLNTLEGKFKIKNNTGYIKAVDAIFKGTYAYMSSKDIEDLPVGTYQLELWITDAEGTSIFPSEGFVTFKINKNTTMVNGEIINTTTIDDLKSQMQEYIESLHLTSGKDATIQIGDVTTVDSDQPASVVNAGTPTDAIFNFNIPKGEKGEQGIQGIAGKDGTDGTDGKSATITVGNVVSLDSSASATVINSGNSTDAVFDFGIPKGEKGDKGDPGIPGEKGADGRNGIDGVDGKSATIKIGSVTSLDPNASATVTNSGNDIDAVFDFGIPKGEKGDKGEQGIQGEQGIPGANGKDGTNGENATIEIGDITTLDSSQPASVTNVGTLTNAVLNFGIPKGEQGIQGEPGRDGTNGKDGIDGENATVGVGSVTTVDSSQSASVTNVGTPTNAVLDFNIPKGEKGEKGERGIQGAPGETGRDGKDGTSLTMEGLNDIKSTLQQFYSKDTQRASLLSSTQNYYDSNLLTLYNYDYTGEAQAYYPYNSSNGGSAALSPIPLDKACQNSGLIIDFDLVTTAESGTFTLTFPEYPNVAAPIEQIKQGTNHYSIFVQLGELDQAVDYVHFGLKISNYTGQLGIKNLKVRINNAFAQYKIKYDTLISKIDNLLESSQDIDWFKDDLYSPFKDYTLARTELTQEIENTLNNLNSDLKTQINLTNRNFSDYASNNIVLNSTKIKGGNMSAFNKASYDEIKTQGQALNLNTVTVSLRVRCDSLTSSTLTVTDDDWSKMQTDVQNLMERGFRVLIQPYPYIANGKYAEVDWQPDAPATWFSQYEPILYRIAEYAEQQSVYGIYVATNLVHLEQYEDDWSRVIQNVKNKYHGNVIFRTNWWKTATWDSSTTQAYQATLNRKFWQYVDIIAIAAYFEVTDEPNPSSEELQEDLHSTPIYNRGQDIVSEIKAFNDKWNKPILFGELGLPPYSNAPSKPYNSQMDTSATYSEITQSNWFDAWYKVFSQYDWWLGYCIFEIGNTTPYNPYGKLANSTIQLQAFGGEHKPNISISDTAPLVPSLNDIWLKPNGTTIQTLSVWNGTQWKDYTL